MVIALSTKKTKLLLGFIILLITVGIGVTLAVIYVEKSKTTNSEPLQSRKTSLPLDQKTLINSSIEKSKENADKELLPIIEIDNNNSLNTSTTVLPLTTVLDDSVTTSSLSAAPSIINSSKDTEYFIRILAIGDWGATTYKEGGSCCNRRSAVVDTKSQEYARNYGSQKNIAYLLAKSAEEINPIAILGHGDSAYWNGVTPIDAASRFDVTFEKIYNQKSLEGIPWFNVLGNHDLAGSAFLCTDSKSNLRKCANAEDAINGLRSRVEGQVTYKSPNGDRWKLSGPYYLTQLNYENISIDIFNVDTNYADSHAANQICCQCYSYVNGNGDAICRNIVRGHKACAGGDLEMYDACMNEIKSWWEDTFLQLERDLKASTADYRIVHTHYSPIHHMSPHKMKRWFDILKKYKVHVYINGHTHGANHEIGSWGTHFFQNGAGGGIQSESGGVPAPYIKEVKSVWSSGANDYGFFEIYASKLFLKLRFITFDKDWVFSTNEANVVHGGSKVGHCTLIPKSGNGYGESC